MTEQILLPPSGTPRRKFWRPWKWVGLLIFAAALLFNRWLPPSVVAVASLYGIAVIANLVIAVLGHVKNRFFWHVRNRLIGSFIFVGVIPLLIIAGVLYLSAYIIFGQLAGRYLSDALQEDIHLISGINSELRGQLTTGDPATRFSEKAALVFSNHSDQFPRLAARLLRRLENSNLEVIAMHDPQGILQNMRAQPGNQWPGSAPSFEGILKNGERLLLTSLRPVTGSGMLYLETTAPLDSAIEERLRKEKSMYAAFIAEEDAGIDIRGDRAHVLIRNQSGSATEKKATEKRIQQHLDAQYAFRKSDPRSMILWFLPLRGKVYESGKEEMAGIAIFYVPRTVILKAYIGYDSSSTQLVLQLIYILAGMLAFAEIVSLIIGVTISRRVTRSVHDLYEGILALQKGDLLHRIPERRRDQLGLLAHSFNQMSESISNLLEEVVEKKRLEQELEIAREVQATLFPKQLPHPPGMLVFGGCRPARVVSGDYYDFIVEDESHLNIAVGDISGKGISAALLMANLQAAIRTQILSSRHVGPEATGQNLAEVMALLNQQIYLSSPPEKYATLFLGRYNAHTRHLWYCNAGHLPPIVLNRHGAQMLEVTGTVVGLFPNAVYQAKSIDLPPGTLLAIFTDGITEAVNKADEEFGEKQLMESLQQCYTQPPEYIWNHVMSRIDEWQADLPQHDDITLILAQTG